MQYYNEIVDIAKLDIIIENYDTLAIDWTKTTKKKEEQLIKLKAYRRKIVNNQVKVCYKESPKQPDGRVYVEKGVGLQSFKKEIRQTITPNSKDYDAKSALPTILLWYAKKNELPCAEIEKLLGNYTLYKKYKQPILNCIFGSKFIEPAIKNIKKEIEIIQTFMVGLFPNRKGVKENNYRGSLCSILLQEYEAQMLTCCEDFLIKYKIPNVNMLKMFDGFELPNTIVIDLDKLNEYIFEKTTIPIIMVEKAKEYILDLSKFPTKEDAFLNEYNDIKETFELDVCMINDPVHFVIKRKNIQRVNKNDLTLLYAHLTIGKKRVPFINEWLKDANKKVYDCIDFIPPPLICNSDTFNLWNGFPIEKTKLVEDSDLKNFFELVNIIGNYDKNSFEYLLNWCADIIQNTGIKTGVALVINGEQGIGKNTFTKIMKTIVGQEYSLETCDPKRDIFCDFNSQATGKILIVINEAEAKDAFANSAKLKEMITEPTENVREKQVKTITVKSFCRLIFLSNKQRIVLLENGDRRYSHFTASDKYKGNTDFFNDINKWIDNPQNIRRIYDFLKNRDISSVNFVADRPITQARLDALDDCKCVELKFLDDLLHDHNFDVRLTNNQIQDKIKKDYHLPFEYDMRTFNGVIKRMKIDGIVPYKSNGFRGSLFEIQKLKKCMIEKNYHKPEIMLIENEEIIETD